CFQLGWRDVVRRGGLNALDDHWDPVRALAARPRRTRRRRADPPAAGGGGGRVPHQPDHGPTPRGLTTTPRSVNGLVPISASPKLFVEGGLRPPVRRSWPAWCQEPRAAPRRAGRRVRTDLLALILVLVRLLPVGR